MAYAASCGNRQVRIWFKSAWVEAGHDAASYSFQSRHQHTRCACGRTSTRPSISFWVFLNQINDRLPCTHPARYASTANKIRSAGNTGEPSVSNKNSRHSGELAVCGVCLHAERAMFPANASRQCRVSYYDSVRHGRHHGDT
jgi:hypothetical protein